MEEVDAGSRWRKKMRDGNSLSRARRCNEEEVE